MPHRTRTKIVCTLGPSSNSAETIAQMVEAGMSVVRLNFSHSNHESHRQAIQAVNQAAARTNIHVGILCDLQGPKVRVGTFEKGKIELQPEQIFTLTTESVVGNVERVSCSYLGLADDVKAGEVVLLDDGLLKMRIVDVKGQDVFCQVEVGGTLRNQKGINLPESTLSINSITKKDLEDLDFALSHQVDYLAMSFVRRVEDVQSMRDELAKRNASIPIIAKIEKPEAVENIDSIIEEVDGIMVARGDLGVEIPAEQVPLVQKQIIAKCREAGKPVITATQMVESMVHNPRPTRAEASDVANAIMDGTDAIMLSAESATGKYPIEAVSMMRRIAEVTEESMHINRSEQLIDRRLNLPLPVNRSIAYATETLARALTAQAICSITLSGSMAKELSVCRPSPPIIAISQNVDVLRGLSLYWGVESVLLENITLNIDEALVYVEQELLKLKLIEENRHIVLTAGVPFLERQATNMVRASLVQTPASSKT